MRRLSLLVPLCLGASSAAIAQTPPSTPNLEGLWVAYSANAPQVGGPLMLVPRENGLVADIAGFTVPVTQRGNALSFDLPDNKGRFRGLRNGERIDGQWIQGLADGGIGFATPVVLHSKRGGSWTGSVVPDDSRLTYYLPLTRTAEGRYSTFLRNPERNQGFFLDAKRLEEDGDTLRLIANRNDKEAVIGTGRIDPDSGAMSLPIQGRVFNFVRDTDRSSPFYPRSNPGERYHYSPPVRLTDGWPVSTLEKEGIDQGQIEKFVQKLIDMPMDDISSSQIHSLLIARHGKLVLEEYFHGYDRDTPHDLRSASKSWTNVLIGAAMNAGVPIRLDTPVYQTMLGSVPADLDPRKKSMTLEHLISMTAGFDCDDSGDRPGDEDPMQQQTNEPNWYRYSLNVPMAWNNGDRIVYCSMKPNLAAGMLQKISGEPLPEMFARLVAKPMHMSNYHLFLQPTGEAYGGGGHHFTTRDFMKLTQLFLNGGKWEGRQIVSPEWVRKSSAPLRVLNPKSGQTYGYLWNSFTYEVGGRKIYSYFPAGNGGQVYIGIPDLDLLIAFTGGNYADAALFRPQREFVPQDILPAVH